MTRPVYVTRPKEPVDIAHIPGIDFRPALTVPGETILSVTDADVKIYLRGPMGNRLQDVTASMLVAGSVGVSNNSIIGFKVQAGSDNKDYLAVVTPTTSTGRKETGEVIIPVRARTK